MRSKIGMSVVAALMVISALLASCSTQPSTPAPSSTSTTGPAATATPSKPSGSVRIAVQNLHGIMDPIATSPLNFAAGVSNMFDSLIMLDTEGHPMPGIAERWEASPDGKTVTFYIRKGVKFHNGDPLTGADVKFSFERFLAPAATHSDAVGLRKVVDSVELKDDYTVLLRLKAPQFELPVGFEIMSGITAVMPKKYIEEKGVDYFRKNPVGSGPFKFVSFTPGTQLVLEANENHWRTVPQFKTYTLDVLTEEAAIVAQLKTGELDLATVSPDSVDALKGTGLKVYQHQTGAVLGWNNFFNRDNPSVNALGDVRVRKALSLAVNRDELAKGLFKGYARPAAMARAVPIASFWDPNVLKPDPFDPEGAKKLLAEAGRPNPSITIFDLSTGALASQYGQALSEYWRKVGVDAKVRVIDVASYTAMTSVQGRLVDPQMWDGAVIYQTTGNIFQFEKVADLHSAVNRARNTTDKELDALIEKIPLTPDPKERNKLQLEAAVKANNGHYTDSAVYYDMLYAYGPKIGSITPIKGIGAVAQLPAFITRGK